MNVEKATKILIRRGIPRRYARHYAELLVKRGGPVTSMDGWNIREDIRLDTRIRREWPGYAVIADAIVKREKS